MLEKRATIQFCGFGGQGIILSSVILGTAAVTKAGLSAVQTQSYGSEARGGECQAELILSPERINSPLSDRVDVLVAMSQPALNQYLARLSPGGTLIYDPDLVKPPAREDVQIVAVPATATANQMGAKITANMYMLGFLQRATGLITADDLCDVIAENVPARFKDANLQAAAAGMAYAEQNNIEVEL